MAFPILLNEVLLKANKLPFSDSFDRGDGDLANGWEYTAGIWTISSNAALGTPSLGSDLIVNGTFDTDSDWTKGAGWSIAGGVAVRDGTAGFSDLSDTIDTLTVGNWYQGDWDLVSHNSGGGFSLRIGANGASFNTGVASYTFCERCISNGGMGVRANAEDGTLDNVVMKQITLADMFATRNFGASNVDMRAAITCDFDTSMGLVISLDSKTAPANFLLATVHRTGLGNKVKLEKCIAGTYTILIADTTIVYSAGKVLRMVKSGASVDVYYDGVQVGTTQTLTDDIIINGKRHGMFTSKGGTCLFDNFFCD